MRFDFAWDRQATALFDDLVDAERVAEQRWRASQRTAIPQLVTASERTEALQAITAELMAKRQAGVFLPSRGAMLEPMVRAELAELGWLERAWRPVPAGVRHMRGRKLGSGDRHWDTRLIVVLPDKLGEVLVRSTYAASRTSVGKLQSWAEQFGWRTRVLPAEGRVWTGGGPSPADLRRRDALLSQISYPADVLRAAAERLVTRAPLRPAAVLAGVPADIDAAVRQVLEVFGRMISRGELSRGLRCLVSLREAVFGIRAERTAADLPAARGVLVELVRHELPTVPVGRQLTVKQSAVLAELRDCAQEFVAAAGDVTSARAD